MQDRIIELLGQGVPAAQVALHVGCDPSYVSQILADENNSLRVQELRATHFEAHVAHDKRIDMAEQKALARIESLVDFITKPSEAARVFSLLNQAKRQTLEAGNSQAMPSTIVNLQLPDAARISFTVTADRQVIEVEGRSMVTMPAKNVAAQLEQRNATRLLTQRAPLELPVSALSEKL
jgi:hypothetical protein